MNKNLFYAIILLIMCFSLSVSKTNAQVKIGSDKAPNIYSLLELDATTVKKGLHMPRLTTTERDALSASTADSLAAKGLAIYNVETDCFNYWNGKKWIDLCSGTQTPEIKFIDFSQVYVYGNYYEKTSLTKNHYITLPVEVKKAGNYIIIAESGNGYYFQTSGYFNMPGSFNVTLDGIGKPTSSQIDTLRITCNGDTVLNFPIEVYVNPAEVSYKLKPASIKVLGEYTPLTPPDSSNMVKVEIEVESGGLANISTNAVNGITFSTKRTLSSNTHDTLIFTATGTPDKSGKFTYTFITNGANRETQSFDIIFKSIAGTFVAPAKSCLEIYNNDNKSLDGEYWIEPVGGTKQKCFCDMTHGGYTMVWSYSEKTAYSIYSEARSMRIWGNLNIYLNKNYPQNVVTNQNDNINYNNWRMKQSDMEKIITNGGGAGWTSPIRVRIATNPKNMSDEWAENNYAELTPPSDKGNPISVNTTIGYALPSNNLHGDLTGKLYGQDWIVNGNSTYTVGGVSYNDGALFLNDGSYGNHWNIARTLATSKVITVKPAVPSGDTTVDLKNMDNVFGHFGDTQTNHHFGKCGQTGDDYSFTTSTCYHTNLYPHSFNGGQGRYLQWFVK